MNYKISLFHTGIFKRILFFADRRPVLVSANFKIFLKAIKYKTEIMYFSH